MPRKSKPPVSSGETVSAVTSKSCPKCFGMLATASGKGIWCTRVRCDYKESP